MSRNNENRTGAKQSAEAPVINEEEKENEAVARSPLEFVTPTDFVELPSRGNGYPKEHPLHGKEVLEIKFMTAKEEDILTSKSLIKNNLALERLLSSLIINKAINPQTILTGDRNAIIVAARKSGFGSTYETTAICPSCGEKSKQDFDLNSPKIHYGHIPDIGDVEQTDQGTYLVTVPVSKFKVELKLMTGIEEQNITKSMTRAKKFKMPEETMTTQYRQMIVSVEGHKENKVIDYFIKNAPSRDTRFLKTIYQAISPDIKIVKDFVCPSCQHEQELEVSFGTDFFWPDR